MNIVSTVRIYPKPENTFVVYYDIEAKGWRTFHAENFLDIETDGQDSNK
ncbi:hypothetical protein BOVAC16_2658 [Bacteroides ovatus]|nr:hypothetical protein BOVAC16_2658 [Bacteroides ovatus]